MEGREEGSSEDCDGRAENRMRIRRREDVGNVRGLGGGGEGGG